MNKPIKHILKGMPTGFYYPSEVDPYIKHLEQRVEAAEAKLVELVPERKSVPESGSTFDSVTHWCDGFNSCIDTILRKIEEQSK